MKKLVFCFGAGNLGIKNFSGFESKKTQYRLLDYFRPNLGISVGLSKKNYMSKIKLQSLQKISFYYCSVSVNL